MRTEMEKLEQHLAAFGIAWAARTAARQARRNAALADRPHLLAMYASADANLARLGIPSGFMIYASVPPAVARAELERELADLGEQMSRIQATADAERRPLRAEEAAAIEALFARFEDSERYLDATIAQMDAPPSRRRTSPSPVSAGDIRARFGGGDLHPDVRRVAVEPGAKGRTWRDLFGNIRNEADSMAPGEFLHSVYQRLPDPRLIKASQVEHTGESGGFLIPATLAAAIWDAELEESVVLPRARIYPASTNIVVVPMADVSDRTTTISGLRVIWMAEGEEGDVQTGKVSTMSMRLNKAMILCEASNEWIEDAASPMAAANAAGYFTNLMAETAGFDIDDAMISGNGVGRPLGILQSPSKITVNAQSGQAPATVLYANVVEMWSRLHPRCQRRAVWLANPSIQPQLFQMAFDESADSRVPIYLPGGNSGAAGEPSPTLFGRPLVATEKAEPLGTEGDLILVDLSQYAVAQKPRMRLDRSTDAKFTSDKTVWRLVQRITGQGSWKAAHTPRGGGPTLSWCVTIETRA